MASLPTNTQESPLRYPGGKSRALGHILKFIPKNISSICSPFFGGGSVELACAKQGIKVYGYDIFEPLINFWQHAISQPKNLSSIVRQYFPLNKEVFTKLQKTYNEIDNKLLQAGIYYTLNRASFSGLTFVGGMSSKNTRFTINAINKLENFQVNNLEISQLDFQESIAQHQNSFLYCDPPYFIKQNLYGHNGMQKNFQHDKLASILKKRDNWILSYNDCNEIREIYKDYNIIDIEWPYSMNKSKKSNEILILSNNLI